MYRLYEKVIHKKAIEKKKIITATNKRKQKTK